MSWKLGIPYVILLLAHAQHSTLTSSLHFLTTLVMVFTLDHTIKLVSKLKILGIIFTNLHDWTSKVHIVGWHILIGLKIMCNVLSFI